MSKKENVSLSLQWMSNVRPVLLMCLVAIAGKLSLAAPISGSDDRLPDRYTLVPYPQEVHLQPGKLILSSLPELIILPGAGQKEKLGEEELRSFFQTMKMPAGADLNRIKIVLGSIDSASNMSRWLEPAEVETLRRSNAQAYILHVNKKEIAIIGRTGQGTLYGVQTLVQILSQSNPRTQIPLLKIVDYPDVSVRYVDMTFAWYAHYHSINFGFGTQLWGDKEWRWFIDWCLAHKINGIHLCIYGYWPFSFPDYPETTLTSIFAKRFSRKLVRQK